jgi:hypothetical protein
MFGLLLYNVANNVRSTLHHEEPLHYDMTQDDYTIDQNQAGPFDHIEVPEAFDEPTKKVHYVDNDEMLAAWMAYQEDRKKAAAEGRDDPVVPRYLAECILKICHRTAYKYNFINYSYRDEMVSDAIENCLRGINTFNPATSKYIFSYYTTAAWNAFIRRIQREENQSAIKGKIICELDVDSIVRQEHDNGEYQTNYVEYMKQAQDYREAHEERKKKSALSEKPTPIHENALIFDDE